MEVWLQLSPECKHDVAVIDVDTFSRALDNYLAKHRFCADCREKVCVSVSVSVCV